MENKKYLLTLTDGGIFNISTNNYALGGCPTCGYGREYFTELDIELSTSVLSCEIKADDVISIGDLLGIFLPNISDIQQLSELEFAEWFKSEICKIAGADNAKFRVIL